MSAVTGIENEVGAATTTAAASYAAARERKHVMDGLRKTREGCLADTNSNQEGRYR